MNRDILCYSVILAGSLFFMFMAGGIVTTGASLANSAFFPRILLGALIVLSSFGLYKALKAGAGGAAQKIFNTPLLFMLGLCIAFVTLLRLAGFVISASLFLFAASLYMSADYSPKSLAITGGMSFAIAFGVNHVFTKILLFILP